MKRDRQVLIVIGALMLVVLLASLDQTIVSTALPTIVGEFGELEHLSWIVTSYLLATTVVTPLYGKLGDLFGRKRVLQGAIVLFLLGSALCGLSQTMMQLILFRALQGLGGGGLLVSAFAAVGDIISPRERGMYQGYFGGVFGVSTVIGPLLGGFFVEHLSWRWIFYINLPLGLLAFLVIGTVLPTPREHEHPHIDALGASFMALMLTSLVLLISLGGHTLPWASPAIFGLGIGAVICGALFIAAEKRAREPVLPLALFRNRTFVLAASVGFIVGLAMFGAITFMPVYLQVVKGISPSRAGMHLMPMMGGMLLTSITSGRMISRIGRYRIFPILGTAIMTIGLSLLATLGVDSSPWLASAWMLVLGLGLGMVMQVLILAVQNALEYRYLGVGTSGTTLFRSMGASFGVALFGAIFSAGLGSALAGTLPAGTVPDAPDAAALAQLPAAARAVYLDAFVAALHPVYVIAAAVAFLAFALTWLLEDIELRATAGASDIGDGFAMPRDATSLEELESILSRIGSPAHRWDMIGRIAKRLELSLAPDEIWLLAQLGRSSDAVAESTLLDAFSVSPGDLALLIRRLRKKGLVRTQADGRIALSEQGRTTYAGMLQGYRQLLSQYLSQWKPEEHNDVRSLLSEFSRELIRDLPRRTVSADT